MDVTASAITIVSSVWTLTVHCKRLFGGVRNSEERIKALEQKGKSFSRVISQVQNAYGLGHSDADAIPITEQERKIREDVQLELARCVEELKGFEKEATTLIKERKAGKFGVGMVLSSWREKVASPVFERIEKSIADHQTFLQSLLQVLHGHQLQETQKDIRQVLAAINGMFDRIQNLAQSQGINGQENSLPGPSERLARRNSETTLVNPAEEIDREDRAILEAEKSDTLHALAAAIFEAALKQGSLPLSSVKSEPTAGSSKIAPIPVTNANNYQVFSLQQFNTPDEPIGHLRKPSYDEKERADSLAPLAPSRTRSTDASFGNPLYNVSSKTGSRQSASGLSGSSTLFPTISSEAVSLDDESERWANEKIPFDPRSQRLQSRTNKRKGDQLLQAIKTSSIKEFESLLLQSDTSLEEKDEKGRTPLILASLLDQVDMVKMLLANGAVAQAVDTRQATALHTAVETLSSSAMSVLLSSKDNDINDPVGSGGGVVINSLDKIGRTPLHYCTLLRCAEDRMNQTARELIDRKADINIKDKAGFPPLYYAIRNRRYSVVELFLERGAELDFNRPETSAEIGKMLDNHIAGKRRSPSLSSGMKRKDGARSPVEQKSPKFAAFTRRWSGAKT